MGDFHKKEFDEETRLKLWFFRQYATLWIPVFAHGKHREIRIYDLFSGPGADKNGVPGSPLEILAAIEEFAPLLLKHRVNIVLHFNDDKLTKIHDLKQNIGNYLSARPDLERVVTSSPIVYTSKPTEHLLPEISSSFGRHPSLVFLDQTGIKSLQPDLLAHLCGKKMTDFIYYVPSHFYKRFGEAKEFKAYHDFDIDTLKNAPADSIHLELSKQLNTKYSDTGTRFVPFSIQKGSNIYGILFGSTHPAGVLKFLTLGWKVDPSIGCANHEVQNLRENDTRPSLFATEVGFESQWTRLTKFKHDLASLVEQSGTISNDRIFEFTLDQGCLPSHANSALSELRKEGKVFFDGPTAGVSNDSVNRKRKTVIVRSRR